MTAGENSPLTATEIEIIVNKSVRHTLTTLGIDLNDVDDLRSVQADFLYMRKLRLGAEDLGKLVKKSVITAIVMGGLYAFWAGFMMAIRKGGL